MEESGKQAAESVAMTTGLKKRLKPEQCGKHIRERLAEQLDTIVDGFVKEAAAGSVQHVKLVCQLLETEPARLSSRKKGVAETLLSKWTKKDKVAVPRARREDGTFVKREQGGEVVGAAGTGTRV